MELIHWRDLVADRSCERVYEMCEVKSYVRVSVMFIKIRSDVWAYIQVIKYYNIFIDHQVDIILRALKNLKLYKLYQDGSLMSAVGGTQASLIINNYFLTHSRVYRAAAPEIISMSSPVMTACLVLLKVIVSLSIISPGTQTSIHLYL